MMKQIKYLDLGNRRAEEVEDSVNFVLRELQEAGHRIDHVYIKTFVEAEYLPQTRVQITYRLVTPKAKPAT